MKTLFYGENTHLLNGHMLLKLRKSILKYTRNKYHVRQSQAKCLMQSQVMGCILYLKGVKKVRSAIKLCSYFFTYKVSNVINVTGIN